MLRILVVEDESSQRNGLIELLCAAGHLARGAASAREAMMLLRKCPVDVVLLDLVLEDTCGVQLLEALRQISASVHIIVRRASSHGRPQLEVSGSITRRNCALRERTTSFETVDMDQLEDALSSLAAGEGSGRWPLRAARARSKSR
jgi:CheY-like chemotaxis protein